MKIKVCHFLEPIYDENSKVIILGTMPSTKSREAKFYYGHPQNRMWKILYDLFNEEYKSDIEDKIKFLKKHGIALFDTIKSCEIKGASDSSITNVVPNDIKPILNTGNIKAIFAAGKTAHKIYMKYIYPETKIEAFYLPSTSPANCKMSYENMKKEYEIILQYVK